METIVTIILALACLVVVLAICAMGLIAMVRALQKLERGIAQDEVLVKLVTSRQLTVTNVEDMIRKEIADLNLDVTDEDAVRQTLMNEIEQLHLCDDCSDKVVDELSQILSTL